MLRIKYEEVYDKTKLTELLEPTDSGVMSVLEPYLFLVILVMMAILALWNIEENNMLGILLVVGMTVASAFTLFNFYQLHEESITVPKKQLNDLVDELDEGNYKGVIFLKGTETDTIGTDYMYITPQEIQE